MSVVSNPGGRSIVLPAVWLGALSWAGVSVGHSLGMALANGSADSKAAGGKVGGAVADTIASKGAGNLVGK